MIFSLLIIHDHERMSSITRVLHTSTWDFLSSRLPYRLRHSPRVVKEAIMTDIDDLVQELMTSSDEAVGVSFFELRRLLGILQVLQVCFRFRFWEVCFDISVFCHFRLS